MMRARLVLESLGTEYPQVRYITSYKTGARILESGNIYSRPEVIRKGLIEDDKDPIWDKRAKSDQKLFNTQDLIFCTIDWFNDNGHVTGHGPVMFYFNDSLCKKFDVTLTLLDSFDYKGPVLSKDEIPLVYDKIKEYKGKSVKGVSVESLAKAKRDDKFYDECAKVIISNLEKKNENGFYDHYAELQIHAKGVPTSYISSTKRTNNFLTKETASDKKKFEKLNESGMRARFVYENVNFERGQDPKDAMKIGRRDLRAISKLQKMADQEGFERTDPISGLIEWVDESTEDVAYWRAPVTFQPTDWNDDEGQMWYADVTLGYSNDKREFIVSGYFPSGTETNESTIEEWSEPGPWREIRDRKYD